MNCKNCGHTFDGKFCSQCGQNSKVGRINFPNFINEVSESIFQVDKGFFYTLKELFVRPGASLKDFIAGKRKNHFKPIAYVLTWSTLYFLITQITEQNTWVDDVIRGWMNGVSGSESEVEFPQLARGLSKNYPYLTLLLLPVFSLASYLAFRKFGKNYLEHIVLNSYITGQQAIFYSLFAIGGSFIKSDVLESLPLLIAILYAFRVFWQFFSEGSRSFNILRSAFTYILYLIFCTVLLTLLVVFYKL